MFKDETRNDIERNVFSFNLAKWVKYLDINPMILIKLDQNFFQANVYKLHIVYNFIY